MSQLKLTPETAALVDLWREDTGLGRSAAVEVLLSCAFTQGVVYPSEPAASVLGLGGTVAPSLGEPVVPVTADLTGDNVPVETVHAPDAAPQEDLAVDWVEPEDADEE